MSLGEAATAAMVSIYEMMDYIDRNRISPPTETLDEIRQERAESVSILAKKLRIPNSMEQEWGPSHNPIQWFITFSKNIHIAILLWKLQILLGNNLDLIKSNIPSLN